MWMGLGGLYKGASAARQKKRWFVLRRGGRVNACGHVQSGMAMDGCSSTQAFRPVTSSAMGCTPAQNVRLDLAPRARSKTSQTKLQRPPPNARPQGPSTEPCLHMNGAATWRAPPAAGRARAQPRKPRVRRQRPRAAAARAAPLHARRVPRHASRPPTQLGAPQKHWLMAAASPVAVLSITRRVYCGGARWGVGGGGMGGWARASLSALGRAPTVPNACIRTNKRACTHSH